MLNLGNPNNFEFFVYTPVDQVPGIGSPFGSGCEVVCVIGDKILFKRPLLGQPPETPPSWTRFLDVVLKSDPDPKADPASQTTYGLLHV